MSQKDRNYIALIDFIQSKEDVKENGNAWWFQASVAYKNIKTDKLVSLANTQIHVGIDHAFGGANVQAQNMPEDDDLFLSWSTNFNVWSFANGILTIDGKDNTGQKGDYVITIM